MRCWMRLCGITAVVLAAGAFVGCERPFIEPRRPAIEVLSPRLEQVLPGEHVRFTVRAESFREVAAVEVNGRALTYDPERDVWTADVTLARGTNRIVIRATDVRDVSAVDTLHGLVYTPEIRRDAADLFTARGGHTATLLDDGSILLAGGATSFNTQAMATALLFRPESNTVANVPTSMHAPRIGHTATTLRDGRVLIAGGAHRGTIDAVSDLTNVVEVYDPAAQSFRRISVSGRAVSRAHHSATYFSRSQGGATEEYILFFGGRGDIRSGTDTPALGVRRDVSTYQFRNDTLIYAGQVHENSLDGVFGHSVTPLGNSPNVAESPHLIAGTYFLEDGQPDDVNFVMSYRNDSGVGFRSVPDFSEPRNFHAAAPSEAGTLVFGGRIARDLSVTDSVEIFEPEARRFFKFPDAVINLTRRWGHTATKLPDGRILLVGGFDAGGSGRTTAEWFQLR